MKKLVLLSATALTFGSLAPASAAAAKQPATRGLIAKVRDTLNLSPARIKANRLRKQLFKKLPYLEAGYRVHMEAQREEGRLSMKGARNVSAVMTGISLASDVTLGDALVTQAEGPAQHIALAGLVGGALYLTKITGGLLLDTHKQQTAQSNKAMNAAIHDAMRFKFAELNPRTTLGRTNLRTLKDGGYFFGSY